MRFLALAALAAAFASAVHAAPIIQSQKPCGLTAGDCVEFSYPAPQQFTVRAMDFNAPGPGQALVSANGSGYCQDGGVDFEQASFVTQIVNRRLQVADYNGPGGNRFYFVLPADTSASGAGVFNLASQRLFTISSAGVQHYALNMAVTAIDGSVNCHIESVALTVVFFPG